jgi:glycerol uptake facilitator-like aquaporin
MASLVQQLLAEALGVFVFFSCIYAVGQPIPIALGLLVAVYIFGSVSGGHFNLTVSLTKWLVNEINSTQLVGYGLAQLVGGMAAVYVSKAVVGK